MLKDDDLCDSISKLNIFKTHHHENHKAGCSESTLNSTGDLDDLSLISFNNTPTSVQSPTSSIFPSIPSNFIYG